MPAPITFTNRDIGQIAGSAGSFTTASISPAAGNALLLPVYWAGVQTISSVVGCSLTWTRLFLNASSNMAVYIGQGTGTTGTIVVTFSNSTSAIAWTVEEIANAEGSIRQAAEGHFGSVASWEVDFATEPNQKNAVYAIVGFQLGNFDTINPPAGFTELNEIGNAPRFESAYNAVNVSQFLIGTRSGSSGQNNTYVVNLELNQIIEHVVGRIKPGNRLLGPPVLRQQWSAQPYFLPVPGVDTLERYQLLTVRPPNWRVGPMPWRIHAQAQSYLFPAFPKYVSNIYRLNAHYTHFWGGRP